MLALITYQTPAKFVQEFKSSYTNSNLRYVKVLSITLLVISFSIRMVDLIFHSDLVKIQNYAVHDVANWIQLAGAVCFLFLSKKAIKANHWSINKKKNLTLAFIVFILLVAFGVSYTVSMYNTKNTLTMFLIGIVAVSLFFAIESKEIIAITIFIVLVFIWGIVFPKISFEDKVLNCLAAFIFGFILLVFSRYSYFFKSKQFVRLKQLEEKNLVIERLNTQKSEILAFVAHDVRNPLGNIETLSSFLLMEEPEKEEVKMIAKAAKQANEIINDLIEVIKLDDLQLQTKKSELSPYLTTIIEKWRTNSKRQITFINSAAALPHVLIHHSKLERVIDNLISNALKFSPPQHAIEITLTQQDNHACIAIKDYGIGIPEKLQTLIFNQFSAAGRAGLQGEKSVGLGLHISQRMVKQHGGKLEVSSIEDEGTTFTIFLPLA